MMVMGMMAKIYLLISMWAFKLTHLNTMTT